MYEDDRVVETEFLKNIFESHFDTERYLQEAYDNLFICFSTLSELMQSDNMLLENPAEKNGKCF